ncbi:MAG: hypothetical protein ABSE97_10235 [Verrucomicrobiota bacterium]|jgi:hypothetical protein
MNSVTDRAVFRDDAQRQRWTLRQRQNISRLLPEEFGWMIESMQKDGSPSSRHAVASGRGILTPPPETDLRSAKPKPKSVNQFSEKLVS